MGQRELTSLLRNHRDAWAKHKDLDPYEAKWLYVEALLKVRVAFQSKYPACSRAESSYRFCDAILTPPSLETSCAN